MMLSLIANEVCVVSTSHTSVVFPKTSELLETKVAPIDVRNEARSGSEALDEKTTEKR